MKAELEQQIAASCKELFEPEVNVELTRPEEQFGDYATNVALQLAKQLGKNPREVGEALAVKLRASLAKQVSEVTVEGPGFVNLVVKEDLLRVELDGMLSNGGRDYGRTNLYQGRVVVIEHTDPNPFKPFHVGHAYSNTIGEAINRLLKFGGGEVHQVSYHGDIGKHIAMAVWAIKKKMGGDSSRLKELDEEPTSQDAVIKSIKTFDGMYYAEGAKAYKEDPKAASEIDVINKQIYAKDPVIMPFYEWGRKKSFGHFSYIYELLNVSFENFFFESETGPIGVDIVKSHIDDKIFAVSEGAIIYKGEDEGLHTRVFINGENLPTYEAKELGLAYAKRDAYPRADTFLVITANEIDEYFRVLKSALTKVDAKLGKKLEHRSHGVVKLPSGKMSSRTGQVVTFASLEVDLEAKLSAKYGEAAKRREITLASMKYMFLKHRIGGDIVYDIDESLNIEGNSGPYLQYAHARAMSILSQFNSDVRDWTLEPDERQLLFKMTEYPEVIENACKELMPHYVCTYLFELAQAFNSFYESNRVIGNDRQSFRITLISAYAGILKNGLNLLNIAAPDKM